MNFFNQFIGGYAVSDIKILAVVCDLLVMYLEYPGVLPIRLRGALVRESRIKLFNGLFLISFLNSLARCHEILIVKARMYI